MIFYKIATGREVSAWIRYLLAIGIFGAALGLRFIVLPVEAGLAFLIFYPGTAISALYCGLMPTFPISARHPRKQ